MEEKKELPLPIPVNVPPKKYVVDGFGIEEILVSIAFGIIGLVLGYLYYKQTNSIYLCFLLPVVFGMIVAVIVRRDKNTYNLIDKFGFIIKFKKQQKLFIYEYFDIYVGKVRK